MQAKIFNADDGSIDVSPISDFAFAKDLARALIAIPGSRVYRVQVIDPLAGDRVLWDTYDEETVEVAA